MKEKTQVFSRRNFYKDDDSGKVFLITVLAQFIMSFLLSLIVQGISSGLEIKTDVITSSVWYSLASAILIAVVYVCIFFFYNSSFKISNKAIRLNFNLKWHTVFICVFIGIVSLLGIQYFIGAVDDFWALIGLKFSPSSLDPTSWGTYFVSLFALVVIPAIGEEVLFRGMILNGLRFRFKDSIAVVFSALLFALMHGSLQQFVYPFLLGLIMGYLVLKTKTLLSSIIVHFVNNFLVITMQFIDNMTGFSFSIPHTWWFYLVALVLLGVTVLIMFLLDKFYFSKVVCFKEKTASALPENEKQQGQTNKTTVSIKNEAEQNNITNVNSQSQEDVLQTGTKTSIYLYIAFGVGALLVIMSILLNL